MFATPTFDVISVNVPQKKHSIANIKTGGKVRSGVKKLPICFAMEEATLPFEIAKPPPNRNIRLHGILVSITFHVIRPSDALFGLLAAVDLAILNIITKSTGDPRQL